MRRSLIINNTHPLNHPLQITICDTFLSRLQGLMFRKSLNSQEGILLLESRDSRLDSAIHMLFMEFDIAVVWINSHDTVVDVKLARRWQLLLASSAPARYILEIPTSRINDFHPGDIIQFKDA